MKLQLLHILAFLIACQSSIAVADLHQLHQSGTEHISFDHSMIEDDQKDAVIADIPEAETTTAVQYDCHHCCHCHGVACHFINTQNQNFKFQQPINGISQDQYRYNNRVISPDLRPPIA